MWALHSVDCACALEKLREVRQGGLLEVRLLNQRNYSLDLWDNARATTTEAFSPPRVGGLIPGDYALDAGFHRHALLKGSLLVRLEYLLN